MKTLNMNVISLAVSLVFSVGAMAQGMSKTDYNTSREKISADYKSAKAACDSMSGNPKDICIAESKAKEKIAKAELEASYKPTPKNRYQAQVAKADADYAVAKERCDDLAGNAKDVCVKEAKAAQTKAKADAKAQMKTTDANATANEKTSEARSKATTQTTEARKDATADKRDAEYAAAKEKCDVYSGDAKDNCLADAKTRFGK